MAIKNAGILSLEITYTLEHQATQTLVILPDGSTNAGADVVAALGLTVEPVYGEASLVWRVGICPQALVNVAEVTAKLRLNMTGKSPLFLNGYESWTDSFERPAAQSMPGLNRVPRFIIDKWVLDGSGDYRFTSYDTRRGHSHGWGYGYVRRSREVSFVGSLDEDSGMTLLRADADAKTLTLYKEAPARVIAAGEKRELISFGIYEGTLDDCTARWLSDAGIEPLPATPLVGFTSWYRHYGDISEEKLLVDLDAVAAELAADELEGAQALFQIDDGFAPVGDWLLPHADRFPHGMKALADAIAQKGLVPGIWLAPFVCEEGSAVYTQHPAWLMRDHAGKVVKTGCNWPGASALDTRNPEVRAYIQEFLHTVTATWGFKLLKLDFLFAACMIPHDGFNRGELMADALELIRASVAPGTTTIMCGVPMVSSFGRTEYCRIGCDVSLDWDDKLYMRPLHRERVSTKNSLANSRGRAHLDGRAFRCDPDVLLLRHDVKLTNEQRAALIEADTTLGGVLLTSDDMAAWDEDQRATWRAAVKAFLAHQQA